MHYDSFEDFLNGISGKVENVELSYVEEEPKEASAEEPKEEPSAEPAEAPEEKPKKKRTTKKAEK